MTELQRAWLYPGSNQRRIAMRASAQVGNALPVVTGTLGRSRTEDTRNDEGRRRGQSVAFSRFALVRRTPRTVQESGALHLSFGRMSDGSVLLNGTTSIAPLNVT